MVRGVSQVRPVSVRNAGMEANPREEAQDRYAETGENSLSVVGIAEAIALAHESLVNGKCFEFVSTVLDRDFEEMYDQHVSMTLIRFMKLALLGVFITILPFLYGHTLMAHLCKSEDPHRNLDSWAGLDCPVVNFARSLWVLLVAPTMLVIWGAAYQLLPVRVQQLWRSKVFGLLHSYLWRLQYHKNLTIFDFVAFGFMMIVVFSLVMCIILKSGMAVFSGCFVARIYLFLTNYELSPGDEAIELVEGKLHCWAPAPGFWPKLRTLNSTICWISVREAFAVETHICPCFGEPQCLDNEESESYNPYASIAANDSEEYGVDVPTFEQNSVSRHDLEARCYLKIVFLPELNKSIEVGRGMRLDDISELAQMRKTPLDKVEALKCSPNLRTSRDILRCYNPHLTCRELLRYFQICEKSARTCTDKVRALESTNAELCKWINSSGTGPLPCLEVVQAEDGQEMDDEETEDLGRSVFAVHSAAAALIK